MTLSKWDKFAQGFWAIMTTMSLIGMLIDISAGNIPHAMSWLFGILFGAFIFKSTER